MFIKFIKEYILPGYYFSVRTSDVMPRDLRIMDRWIDDHRIKGHRLKDYATYAPMLRAMRANRGEPSKYIYKFNKESDAVLFKLTWC